MKVLHVLASLAPRYGWPVDLVGGLVRSQKGLGHGATVATTNLDGSRPANPADVPGLMPEVEVRCARVDAWPYLIRDAHLRGFGFSRPLAALLADLVAQYDMVHIYGLYLYSSRAAARACQKRGIPYVVSALGNLDPLTQATSRGWKEAAWLIYQQNDLNRAAGVHFLSHGEAEAASAYRFSAPRRVVGLALSPGAYRAHISPPMNELARAGTRVILYLGRIAYTKGIDLLVESFAKVRRQHTDTHLVVVGSDYKGYLATLEDRINKLGLHNHVTFTGFVPPALKVSWLQQAEVMVVPSYTEAFGMVILEALAAGCPLIVTRGVAIAEELGSSGAVLLADQDANSLAGRLLEVLNNPNRRRTLIAAADRVFDARYRWEVVAPQFIDMYEKAIAYTSGDYRKRQTEAG